MIDDEDEPVKEVVPDADDETSGGPQKPAAQEPAAKKPAAKKPAAKKPAAKKSAKPKDNRVKILLEENDDIPPNGLFLGLNGRGFLLRPGEEAMVPEGIVEILENAVMSAPVVEPQTKQVIGYRDRLKYPFRKL